jgi:23S rRNA (uracil1939-C5)-methyltransferase
LIEPMDFLNCEKLGKCGGCPWGARSLSEQRREKLSAVEKIFATVHFVDTPAIGLRDRADLVWQDGRLGLYALDSREIVDLPACPMMSPALETFFKEFRTHQPPIRKGSVRLRVSPAGERGAWLDFANADVKALFDEREYLRWLIDLAFVEIGQRRKALHWRDGAPKLVDPELRPWFETYDENGAAIPLYGPVGGFSQAGFVGNRALVGAVSAAVKASGVHRWSELFCGNGNFALALAARGYAVEAVELEALAVDGLQKSLQLHPDWNVRVNQGDVYLKTGQMPVAPGLLIDPPRAGLRQLLDALEKSSDRRPQAIVYVSCFTDVFLQDSERLRALGYELRSLVGVDQFAHSTHSEWVSLFIKAAPGDRVGKA